MHRWITVAAVFPIRKHWKEPARQCTVYPTLIAYSWWIEVILAVSSTEAAENAECAEKEFIALCAHCLSFSARSASSACPALSLPHQPQ